jgi:RecA/RadA recombinase
MPRTNETSVCEQIKQHARKPVEIKSKVIDRARLVPSGSTMLNLACTDTVHGAFLLGEFTNIVGGFSTGKTSGTLEVFAACAQQKRFDNHRFIFDEPERSNEFDMEKQYGKRVSSRIEPPARDKDSESVYSRTVEDFEINLRRAIKGSRPVIYVLDSFDALTSEQEVKKSDARVGKADRKKRGEETEKDKQKIAGSYGMEKAKGSSSLFRLVTQDLKDTQSLLIIISQTRQEIDPMKASKYRRNGGDALDFYASHVIWLSCIERIRDTVHKRQLGDWVRAKIDKNKATGKKRSVDYPTYVGYGIDDIDSMIEFLIADGELTSTSLSWAGEPFRSRKALIAHFDGDKNAFTALRTAVAELWMKIEADIKLDRRPKYI